jgi:hypothetical protein
MKRYMVFSVLWAAAILAASPTIAGPRAAYADAECAITVSGTWTSMNWYTGYSGSYLETEVDPYDDDLLSWPYRSASATNISTSVTGIKADANSSALVSGPPPRIDIDSHAGVYDINDWGWAFGYSQASSDWLISGADQTVTVTISYSYDLDLSQAQYEICEAEAKFYLNFWDPASSTMLWDKGGFTHNTGISPDTFEYLVRIDTPGADTGLVSGSTSWQVSVANGAFYSFWGQADAYANLEVPEPATMLLVGAVAAGLGVVRKKKITA